MNALKSQKRLFMAAALTLTAVILLPHQPWTSVVLLVVAVGLVAWDGHQFRKEQLEYERESDASLEALRAHCTTPPRGEEED
jgi:hypothetical protein